MTTLPISYDVEVLWSDVQTSAIQFDITTFGELDNFTDPFYVDWVDPTIELIDGVTSINITRGRDDNLDFYSMGECTITIEDPTGTYNPANDSSPLYGKLRPMRPIRVTAKFGPVGAIYDATIYTGLIRSIEFSATDGNRGIATIIAGDFFLPLSKSKPVFPNAGRDTTTGEVLATMMAAVGDTFPYGVYWNNRGDVIPSPGVANTATGQTALQLAASLMEIERGDFFVDRLGNVQFNNRNMRATTPTLVSPVFTDVGTRVASTTDLDRVKNKASVVKQTGVGDFTAEWSDGPSVANYGQQDFGTISSFYIYDASQATALAQWLVSQRKSPTSTLRSLELVLQSFDDATAYDILFNVDLTSKISVEEASTGLPPTSFFVESVRHNITPSMHRISFGLVKDDALAMILAATDNPVTYPNSILDTNTLAY